MVVENYQKSENDGKQYHLPPVVDFSCSYAGVEFWTKLLSNLQPSLSNKKQDKAIKKALEKTSASFAKKKKYEF